MKFVYIFKILELSIIVKFVLSNFLIGKCAEEIPRCYRCKIVSFFDRFNRESQHIRELLVREAYLTTLQKQFDEAALLDKVNAAKTDDSFLRYVYLDTRSGSVTTAYKT